MKFKFLKESVGDFFVGEFHDALYDALSKLVAKYNASVEDFRGIDDMIDQICELNNSDGSSKFNNYWFKKKYGAKNEALDDDISEKDIRKSLIANGAKLPESKTMKKSKKLTESANSEFEAFITNLSRYQDIGADAGQWVEFPIDESEFNKVLDAIGCNEPGQEEWFVTDYNSDVDAYEYLGEYPSFEQLNEFAEMINDDAFKAILEDRGDFDSAKSVYESGDYAFYPNVNDWSELAEYIINEFGGVEQLDRDTAERYFDYEALGRELDFDTYESEDEEGNEVQLSAGEYWCGDENASDEDIGYAYVDQVGFDGVGNIEYYFDFDSYGRDLSFDNFTMTDYGVIEIF